MAKNINHEDSLLIAFKRKFFVLASKEDYPHTPAITRECDQLVEVIREMMVPDKARNNAEYKRRFKNSTPSI